MRKLPQTEGVEHDQPDGVESTARHWIRVYTKLARFADDVAAQSDLTPEAALQMERRRDEIARCLRFWHKELAAILASNGMLV